MTVEIIHIKGKFKGKYSGSLEKFSSGNSLQYTVDLYEKQIQSAVIVEPYEQRYLSYNPYINYAELKGVLIHLEGQDNQVVFQEDLKNVLINDIQLSHVHKEADKTYGFIEGIIYATYIYERVIPECKIYDLSITVKKENPVSNIWRNIGSKIGDTNTDKYNSFLKKISNDETDKSTMVLGQNVAEWENRFLGIKHSFIWFILGFVLLWFLIHFLGINYFSVLLTTLFAIQFLQKIISPVLGWKQVPSSQQNNMVSTSSRNLRRFYTFSLALALFIAFFLHWKILTWTLLALLLLQLFTYSTVGVYQTRRIWQWLGALVLIGCSLAIFNFASNFTQSIPKKENVQEDKVIKLKKDTTAGLQSLAYNITWKDYHENLYSGNFKSAISQFNNSRTNRIAIKDPNGFQEVYNRLWANDKTLLPSLIKMLDSIKTQKQLSDPAFLDMTVSLVQYIPYVLVHDESCAELLRKLPEDEFIQSYHRSGKECLPETKFGIQAPAEFGYNLRGDCDTRAMLLFTLLSHFKFDVAMLVSEAYGHCVLGINIPGNGLYKNFQGKRYFVWETTAKNFQLGQLPAEVSNMENWNIALTSNN